MTPDPDSPRTPPVPAHLAEPDAQGWRTLSPRKMLLDPVKALGSALVPMMIAIVSVREVWATVSFLMAGVGFAVLGGVVPYLTTRYRITGTHFEVRTGWLNRKTNTAALTRIRSVDLEATLLYRMLSMQKITIGTGVDSDKVELDALPTEDARALQTLLLARRRSAGAVDPHPTDALGPQGPSAGSAGWPAGAGLGAELGRQPAGWPGSQDVPAPVAVPVHELAGWQPGWARFAPLHLTGFVLLASGVGAVIGFLTGLPGVDEGDLTSVWDWVRQFAWVAVALVAVVVVLGAWLVLSLASYVSEWFGLRLWRQDGSLHLTRGLLTTRSVSLEEQRIRGVVVTERLLVRWFGGAELSVQSSGEGSSDASVLPTAPREVVLEVGSAVLGDRAPLLVPASGHPVGALRRRLWWGSWPAGGLLLVTLVARAGGIPTDVGAWLHDALTWSRVLPVAVVVALWGLVAGWLAYRHLGHAVTERHLVRTHGIFSLRRQVLETDGIIGWVITRSVFQRRIGLATLVATTASGEEAVAICDLDVSEAYAVAAACTPATLAPFIATR